MTAYLNPKTGSTIGYQETKGTTAEPFNAPMAWQASSLSYITLSADASGNLLVSGTGGGGGSNAAAGSVGSAPPGYADYQGWNNAGALVGTSLTSALPVQPGTGAVFTVNSTIAANGNAPAAVSVGVASTAVLGANAARKGLTLVNTSSNTISLAFGNAAVLNSGITLVPFGTFTMDAYDYTTAAINAIASAASSNLAVQEWA